MQISQLISALSPFYPPYHFECKPEVQSETSRKAKEEYYIIFKTMIDVFFTPRALRS